jgi:N-acetylmuramoyl-L-alanine amidase
MTGRCRQAWPAILLVIAAATGCSSGTAGSPGTGLPNSAVQPATVQPTTGQPTTGQPTTGQPTGQPGTGQPTMGEPTAGSSAPAGRPLAGKIIGIDPGHNGRNTDDPGYIDRLIWNGQEWEACDTTGTETDAGYTEAQFNFNVASYLKGDLVRDGAKVVVTRPDNNGVGPCVNERAEIIDHAHASVAIDIHADGGPPSGRGFTVLEPVADGPNDNVIGPSERFGDDVRAALLRGTSMPESDYYGHDGVIARDDLAGLNLTTVPKVLVECGNMRNATDAALLIQPAFQRALARAFTAAIVQFLTGR